METDSEIYFESPFQEKLKHIQLLHQVLFSGSIPIRQLMIYLLSATEHCIMQYQR